MTAMEARRARASLRAGPIMQSPRMEGGWNHKPNFVMKEIQAGIGADASRSSGGRRLVRGARSGVHVPEAPVRRERDRPARLRRPRAKARGEMQLRSRRASTHGEAAGAWNRRRELDLLRPCQHRIDAPERTVERADGEERAVLG